MWPWVVFWVYFPSLKLNLVERACHPGTFETDSSAAGVKRSLNLNSITFGHDIIWYHLNGTPYGISWIWYLVSKKNCSYSWWYRPLKGIRKTITSTHIYQRAHIHAFTSTHTCAQFHGQSSFNSVEARTCTCLKQRRSHIAVSYMDYHVRMGGWVGGSYRAKFEYICIKKHGLTTGDVHEPPFAWIPGSSAIASQLYTVYELPTGYPQGGRGGCMNILIRTFWHILEFKVRLVIRFQHAAQILMWIIASSGRIQFKLPLPVQNGLGHIERATLA